MFGNDHKSAVRKALKVCEAVAEGDFEARIIGIDEKGEAAALLHAVNRLIDRCDAYVRESRASLEYVAQNKYFRRIAERGMTGAFGEVVETTADFAPALERARAAGRIAVLELRIEPELITTRTTLSAIRNRPR